MGIRRTHLVHYRLERDISNTEWTELYPSCRSQYLRYEGSDHRPLLSFMDPTRKKGNRIFRYDRRLKDNDEVKKLISDSWSNFSHLTVESRLALCRKAISKCSPETQLNSQKKIISLKHQLEEAMTASTHDQSMLGEINMHLLVAYKAEDRRSFGGRGVGNSSGWPRETPTLDTSMQLQEDVEQKTNWQFWKMKHRYLISKRNILQESSPNTIRSSSLLPPLRVHKLFSTPWNPADQGGWTSYLSEAHLLRKLKLS